MERREAIRVDHHSIYEYFINPSADQDRAAHTSHRADGFSEVVK